MAYSKFGGMIMPVAFTSSIPSGWLPCDGRAISRTTYANLFALIAGRYGPGDGSTTFNIPNLSGRGVVGAGSGSGLSTYTLAQAVGEDQHTLVTAELPSHQHAVLARSVATAPDPTGGLLGDSTALGNCYRTGASDGTLLASCIGFTGSAIPHDNRQPYTAIQYLIATDDVDPLYVVGEVRIWPDTSTPTNWDLCDGTSYTTVSRAALFSAIGYTFGGVGANFNVPDLLGRLVVGVGSNPSLSTYALGDKSGAETVALTTPTIPSHSHIHYCEAGRGSAHNGNNGAPAARLVAQQASTNWFSSPTSGSGVTMHADACKTTGSGTAHENRMKVMALNFLIAKSL